MKNYHITTNGAQQGPYPETQIAEMIASGQLQRTDLCWTEGMSDWAALESVISLPPVLPPPVPVTSPSRQDSGSEPWFLYIPVSRLIFMSLISLGLFEAYWIYKNWRYLKERDGLKIMPFWRGVFGIFFIHGILKEIKNDRGLSSLGRADYSPGALATGWIILMFLGNALGRADDIAVNLVGIVLSAPTFLFLLPAQNYINRINARRSPAPRQSPWSAGHIVVLIVGIIFVGLILIGALAPEY